jgi:hypothetical protein
MTEYDDTDFSYHREPEFVGGKEYIRCKLCGSESVPADPRRLLHDEECEYRGHWGDT